MPAFNIGPDYTLAARRQALGDGVFRGREGNPFPNEVLKSRALLRNRRHPQDRCLSDAPLNDVKLA